MLKDKIRGEVTPNTMLMKGVRLTITQTSLRHEERYPESCGCTMISLKQ